MKTKFFLTPIPEFFSRLTISGILLYYINNQQWYHLIQYITDITILFWVAIPIIENSELNDVLNEMETNEEV